ncbi:MAG: tRNA pseudouridine(38-40) synthase TruA [Melioribacteraceae bacterium]
MNNYLLTIQYDGSNYSGWQVQKNALTVQQKIIDSIQVILKERVNLIGSGRTDSGVHALGQAANFRTENELDIYKFKYSLNSILPNDISVMEMRQVDEKFHARFDARSRSYLYIISHRKSPFYYKYSFYNPAVSKMDLTRLNTISKTLIGRHDFTSFSKKNADIDDRICTITDIHWRRGTDFTCFYITANRFLHGMVRTIVGTLLYAIELNLDGNYLINVLEQMEREKADESVPARGLFLLKVRY